jgi:hypothetical protein
VRGGEVQLAAVALHAREDALHKARRVLDHQNLILRHGLPRQDPQHQKSAQGFF